VDEDRDDELEPHVEAAVALLSTRRPEPRVLAADRVRLQELDERCIRLRQEAHVLDLSAAQPSVQLAVGRVAVHALVRVGVVGVRRRLEVLGRVQGQRRAALAARRGVHGPRNALASTAARGLTE
jgi:hypothetical protein